MDRRYANGAGSGTAGVLVLLLAMLPSGAFAQSEPVPAYLGAFPGVKVVESVICQDAIGALYYQLGDPISGGFLIDAITDSNRNPGNIKSLTARVRAYSSVMGYHPQNQRIQSAIQAAIAKSPSLKQAEFVARTMTAAECAKAQRRIGDGVLWIQSRYGFTSDFSALQIVSEATIAGSRQRGAKNAELKYRGEFTVQSGRANPSYDAATGVPSPAAFADFRKGYWTANAGREVELFFQHAATQLTSMMSVDWTGGRTIHLESDDWLTLEKLTVELKDGRRTVYGNDGRMESAMEGDNIDPSSTVFR